MPSIFWWILINTIWIVLLHNRSIRSHIYKLTFFFFVYNRRTNCTVFFFSFYFIVSLFNTVTICDYIFHSFLWWTMGRKKKKKETSGNMYRWYICKKKKNQFDSHSKLSLNSDSFLPFFILASFRTKANLYIINIEGYQTSKYITLHLSSLRSMVVKTKRFWHQYTRIYTKTYTCTYSVNQSYTYSQYTYSFLTGWVHLSICVRLVLLLFKSMMVSPYSLSVCLLMSERERRKREQKHFLYVLFSLRY